jgi:hypothetical protein
MNVLKNGFKADHLRQILYGCVPDVLQQHWETFMEESVADERMLNDEFLAESDKIM